MTFHQLKVRGVQIQVKDSISKKSKSFTVHGVSCEKLFYELLLHSKNLQSNKHTQTICHKEEQNGGEKTIN